MTKKVRLLLLRDVRGSGKRGAIVAVAAGYAEHALLPRGDAVYADAGVLRVTQQTREQEKLREEKQKESKRNLAQRLTAARVIITARANEKGVLYGSVTSQMIARALNDQGITVAERSIGIPRTISACGEHRVTVRLDSTFRAAVKIIVRPAE